MRIRALSTDASPPMVPGAGQSPSGPDSSSPDDLQLVFERLNELYESALRAAPRLAIALGVLILTWAAAAVLSAVWRRVTSRWRQRESLKDLFRQLFGSAVWVCGLLVAANVAFPSLTPGRTLTALGVGSIAIGFAFKDIFENFFAGALILWRFPFENGDFIRCGEIMGRVERTTIRMTLVRQVDGRLLVVPNSLLFKQPVEVLTWRELARVEVVVGVDYSTSLPHAKDVVLAVLRGAETVAQDRPMDVQTVEFSSSSMDLRLLWWTGSRPSEARASIDEVLTGIKTAFDEAGITIPFPQRVLTFANRLETEGGGSAGSRGASAGNS